MNSETDVPCYGVPCVGGVFTYANMSVWINRQVGGNAKVRTDAVTALKRQMDTPDLSSMKVRVDAHICDIRYTPAACYTVRCTTTF